MVLPEWGEARNILAIRLDNLGDVIMTGPALRAIKEGISGAKVTLLASPTGTQAAPLLPWIDRVITRSVVWQDVGSRMPLDRAREMRLVKDIHQQGFDAAILFTSFSQSPYPPAYVCYLARVPLRLGQSKEFGGSLLTTWVKSPGDGLHQADRNLHLVESVGFSTTDARLFVQVPQEARRSAREKLAAKGIDPDKGFVVIHPGASCQARTYPWGRYVEVANLVRREMGLQVVITGHHKDARRVEQMGHEKWSSAAVLAGETTVEEYAALLEMCSAVIAGNTSAMHMADALGRPSAILYSGTDLESQWLPRHTLCRSFRRETSCHPCYLFVCPYGQPCLDIGPSEVAQAVEELLDPPGRHCSDRGGTEGRGDERRALTPSLRSPKESGPLTDSACTFGVRRRVLRTGQALTFSQGERGFESASQRERRFAWLSATDDPIRKVAVVRALNFGDLLVAIPALRALRAALRHAEITLIGLRWAMAFAHRFSAYLDRWIEFPGYPGILEGDYNPEKTAEFLQSAQSYGYDLAIQMHGDGSVSNCFTAALGARFSAGYHLSGMEGQALTLSLPYPDDEKEVMRHLRLMEFLGIKAQGTELEFPVTDDDVAELERLPEFGRLRGGSEVEAGSTVTRTGPRSASGAAAGVSRWEKSGARGKVSIGIHPGARPPARRWQPERFAAVADALADEYGGTVVLLGGQGEEGLAGMVQEHMRHKPVNLAGKTTIGALAALMKTLDLVIANDSGPSHLAEAVGVKSVTLFGPADPRRWAPVDQSINRIVYRKAECSPCRHGECPIDHRCMGNIAAEDVLLVARGLLEHENGKKA